jgi:FkbM family methyltransferase
MTDTGTTSASLPRLRRFLRKPLTEKVRILRNRWHLLLSGIPVPARLPLGFWWIKRNDNLAETLLAGSFEATELAFVDKFLRPGMTVLDIGAHQGLYTLLASARVGLAGRVFSFEPSPRERRALRLHLALNLCRNVRVQSFALGSEEGEATLHVVQGSQTGCNSLRPPEVISSTSPIRVRVTTLDAWLKLNSIATVDFIKLDVEGAELEVLKGAARLLENRPRPVILAEVQDVRTAPWGYGAKEILLHLRDAGYTWLRLIPDGSLTELDLTPQEFDGNFVACPLESTVALQNSFLPRP